MGQSRVHTSSHFAANHSAAVHISHISSVPTRLPNHIARLLALTSNETCDDSCHTGGSRASRVAGVRRAAF